jgi:6-phosphogluconolactonase/glucosamine-6-phosphate isomerase/deaminase
VVLKEAVEGEITPLIPASYLQKHSNCTFALDKSVKKIFYLIRAQLNLRDTIVLG